MHMHACKWIARVSVLFIVCFFVQPAFGATFVVTKTADTADGTCAEDCSLREAVIAANSAGGANSITVPTGTYTLTIPGDENVAATGDLDVIAGSSLTINGAGSADTIINANGGVTSDRAFHLTTATSALTLQNLTVTGGSQSDGGGIYTSGELTLSNVVVTSNTVLNAGGGIASVGASAVVIATDSSVTSNSVSNGSGGGLYNTLGSVTLTRVLVDSNEAFTAGGIFNDRGQFTMSASVVSNNAASGVSANATGGGIKSVAGGAVLTISDSLITGNSAYAAGGGVQSFCSNSVATITNSTISHNTSSTGSGGGVYAGCSNGAPLQTDQVSLSHSTVAFNTAASGGGLGQSSDGDDTATILVRNSIVSNNTATTGSQCKHDGTTGSITSDGYNIESANTCGFAGTGDQVGVNPLLDATGLADHGGDTQLIALQAASPAINTGVCTDSSLSAVTTDQRGYTRPEGSSCDIGAYEKDQTDPVVTVTGFSPTSMECQSVYTDGGATAVDNWDGPLSVTTDQSALDPDVPGVYSVNYSATDADSNEGTNTRSVEVVDTNSPTISVVGPTEVTQEAGTAYSDPGATVEDVCDGSVSVDIDNPVNTAVLGDYVVTYTATDASSNEATSQTRTVHVTDTLAPTITLLGESEVTIWQGEVYVDSGATAEDAFEGNVTNAISVDNPVNTTVPGEYTITYAVADSSGNAAVEVIRTVVVLADAVDPIVTLLGENPYTVLQGADFTDPGATAVDVVGGDLTTDIVVVGSVDTSVVGEYTISYSVSDAAGNVALVERTVSVVSRGAAVSVAPQDNGVLLVTYEDGSSQLFSSFTTTAQVHAVFSTDGQRIVVLQPAGKKVRVLDATLGTVLSTVKLAKRKQQVARLKVFNYYSDEKDEVIVAVKKKQLVRVFALSLGSDGVLSGKNMQRISGVHTKALKITRKKKSVVIKAKSGTVLAKYHVSRNAVLSLRD